jgi:hypothetical protein
MKYQNMRNAAEYSEFISLLAFLFAKEFKRRHIEP